MARPATDPGSWWSLWFQVVTDLFRVIGTWGREIRDSRGRHVVTALPLAWLLLVWPARLRWPMRRTGREDPESPHE